MGLFKRKARQSPDPPLVAKVFVTHEGHTDSVTRIFFTDKLIERSSGEVVDGWMRFESDKYLPDQETYEALKKRLAEIVHKKSDDDGFGSRTVRCYPHYIAISWLLPMQPEEDISEARARIESELLALLAEHFDWDQPVQVGRLNSDYEKVVTARRLGVDWTLGG